MLGAAGGSSGRPAYTTTAGLSSTVGMGRMCERTSDSGVLTMTPSLGWPTVPSCNDTREALAAFRRRRAEVLVLLRSLSPAEWQRAGVHLSRGRLTLADWVARLAGHDDNHVAQLRRVLQGRA